MLRFRFRAELIAGVAALAATAAPAHARAGEAARGANIIVVPGNSEEAQVALANGLAMIRRVLHLTQDAVVSHTVSLSTREAALELEMAGGHTRTISLRDGDVLIDGERVGRYAPDGQLDRAWRSVLADGGRLDTRGLLAALQSWRARGLPGDEAAAKARLDDVVRGLGATTAALPARADTLLAHLQTTGGAVSFRLGDLQALDSISRQLSDVPGFGGALAEAVHNTPVHVGSMSVGAGERHEGDLVILRGTADIRGEVTGSVVALHGNITLHPGAVIGRNAVAFGGTIDDLGGTVHGELRTVSADAHGTYATAATRDRARSPGGSAMDQVFADVRNVLAVFVALAMTGFGAVFFGRRYIEVVADTARHSFGRSLVAGMLGQLLVLPTFAMLVVGLVFTVVGILLLPFAAVAFVLAAAGAILGGYLAIAHAVGETFTRRRMAHGAFVRAPNAYGYLFTGLIGLLGLWAAAALFGWAGPVVLLFRVAAAVVTWMAATAGFGAVLLSRAGLRETFAGRNFGEMSDEYLWATPPATPAARSGVPTD